MTLPPLPEPAYQHYGRYLEPVVGYTEAQMLAYRDATVEACAESVEALERNGAWVTREEVLNAIRSMK